MQLDYVAVHGGKIGQRFAYSLLFDGDADTDSPQLIGLVERDPVQTSRGKTATSRGSGAHLAGQNANLAGRLRGDRGPVAGTSRGTESTRKPKPDAASSVPVPALTAKPRSRKVNGHAVAGH